MMLLSAALFLTVCGWAFWRGPGQRAAVWGYLGGWLLLPVGWYPPLPPDVIFPFWLTGAAVPSDMLWTKAAFIPLALLAGSALADRPAWRGLRWHVLDGVVLAWCLWPLLQGLLRAEPGAPSALAACLYQLATWGGSWLLGRLYCSRPQDRRATLVALAWAGAACLPWALLEGVGGLQTYGWFFEPHPFRLDGVDRYLGQRPVAFFENGNQYGVWVSLCALAGLVAWRWPDADEPGAGASRLSLAVGLAWLVALAAQSVGALVLAGLGYLMTWGRSHRWVRRGLLVALSGAVVLGAVYASGVLPLMAWGKNTALGRQAVQAFRVVGRGSLPWRVAQDQRALPIVKQRPWVGQARWDWWRPAGTRPWGLVMLVAGQFGLLALGLMMTLLLVPVWLGWRTPPGQSPGRAAGAGSALRAGAAMIVLMATLDAMLNAFFFFPALLLAGGLVALRSASPEAEAVRC